MQLSVTLSYLVSWTGYTHEYTDWVPVGNVTLAAVHDFNPPPGQPGTTVDGMQEAAAAEAELKEWWSSHAAGTLTVMETAQLAFYDRLQFMSATKGQQAALQARRSRKKRDVSKPGAAAPKKARQETGPSAINEVNETTTEPTTSGEGRGGGSSAGPARSPQSSVGTVGRSASSRTGYERAQLESALDSLEPSARSQIARALSSIVPNPTAHQSKKRKKTASQPPSAAEVNHAASVYGAKIRSAAVALRAAMHAREDGTVNADAAERAADKAVRELNLPNTARAPAVKLATHHSNANLQKCVAPVPRTPFTAGVGKWSCECGGATKLATLAKVKIHLLTFQHLRSLQPSQRGDIAGGARLANAARDGAAAQAMGDTLRRRICVRACLSIAQHGEAFTTGSRSLRLAQSVVYDITDGVAPPQGVIASLRRPATAVELAAAAALETVDATTHASVIAQLRRKTGAAERRVAAEQLTRLTELSEMKARNGLGPQIALHLDRTNISRAFSHEIEPAVDRMIDELLKKCRFVALLLDESKSTSWSDPLYSGVQFCTADFEWGLHLVGQTDTSVCTTGEDLHLQVKGIFDKRPGLFDKILFGASDGCHAMRSTREYAGIHPRSEGESLLTRLQDELAERRTGDAPTVDLCAVLMFIHCVCHIIALAFKDACGVLPPHVMPHLRSFHRVFHNSLKHWSELEKLCKECNLEMQRTNDLRDDPIDDVKMYRVTRFKSLSPTRWKDLLRVVNAILDKWTGLVALRDRRIEQGYGCPSKDESSWDKPKSKKDVLVVESEDKDSESSDDSWNEEDTEDEDEEEEEEEGEEDEEIDAVDINGIPASAKNGGNTNWRSLGRVRCTGHCGEHAVDGAVAPPAAKRTTLLSDGRGVTPLNHLIDSVLADLMETHVSLVCQLETRAQPIAHKVVGWIRSCHRKLKLAYIDGFGAQASYGPVYKAARIYYNDVRAGNEVELVKAVDELAKTFALALISSSTARLQPYWPTLQAFALADPSTDLPGRDADGIAVWDAAEVLCKTADIDFDKFGTQITELHAEFPEMAAERRSDCEQNLLRFYNKLAKSGGLDKWPEVRAFAVVVFTFPATTVFIECLFSGMKLNKSKTRSSMTDDKCVGVLKARELRTVLTRNDGKPEPPPSLDLQGALDHNLG